MKRSGWAPGTARIENASQKKGRARTVNQNLKDSYRLHARDRAIGRLPGAMLVPSAASALGAAQEAHFSYFLGS